ncbi:MAG TPA: thiamine-phosphate kinase [Terracidiphilus sp.]|nr:thiamine-phosphate kinase [Terracidiphilus sp.]
MPSTKHGEVALIQRIRDRAARMGTSLPLGIGDDCALLRFKAGEEAAVTTDLSVENRHFRLDLHPPEAIGHRTLARGLSDLASMGARPVAAFLSLGLRSELISPAGRRGTAWVDRFLDGFFGLAEQNKVPLAGGDVAESSLVLADIVVIGAVPRGKGLLRSGANPGDSIYVTGRLGGSAAALRRFSQGALRAPNVDLAPHLWPQPRIQQGVWLRRHSAATAAIDISDGLSTDLHHLCAESGVCAEIEARSLPIFQGATLSDALNGGEDYELLFTARQTARIPRRIAGVPVCRIGVIGKKAVKRARVTLVDTSGLRTLEPRGWEHFRTESSNHSSY